MKEGAFKPGGKYIGILSKEPKRMVKCPKCKGTGDMSATKSGVSCDKCHGTGKLFIDPGRKKPSEEYFESTVGAIAGFNGPMGSTNKKGIKHNISIKENDFSTKCICGHSRDNHDFKKEEKCEKCDCDKFIGSGIKEMKTFKRILNEIDLSTKDKTLTHFLTQVSQTGELNKQFGANYKPETFMDWLRSKVENYGLSVSEKYLNAMESNIKNKTPNQAQMYVYNALLKGSNLGLSETKRIKKINKRDEEI